MMGVIEFLWKYSSKNDYPNIILHDCKIEKVMVENGNIIFVLDDSGFWVNKGHSQNPYGQILRTDKAEIQFNDCDFIRIYLFKEFRFLGKHLFTIRKSIAFDNFCAYIDGGRKFEFIDEYYSGGGALFCGWIWQRHKPYHTDCQIEINYTEMIYLWNRIYEDRTW